VSRPLQTDATSPSSAARRWSARPACWTAPSRSPYLEDAHRRRRRGRLLSIQYLRVDAFGAAIDRCLDLALRAEDQMRRRPELEFLSPANLRVVCFRRRPEAGEGEEETARRNGDPVGSVRGHRAGIGVVDPAARPLRDPDVRPQPHQRGARHGAGPRLFAEAETTTPAACRRPEPPAARAVDVTGAWRTRPRDARVDRQRRPVRGRHPGAGRPRRRLGERATGAGRRAGDPPVARDPRLLRRPARHRGRGARRPAARRVRARASSGSSRRWIVERATDTRAWRRDRDGADAAPRPRAERQQPRRPPLPARVREAMRVRLAAV
jgi:hypothetical protein